MQTPVVSIVLPAFNRLRFLREAVDSVRAQTTPDWELIVSDDGSQDETQGYLRALVDQRIRVIWLAHTGNPSAVRNSAIRAARGTYVAFLDSDDIWMPSKLEVQLSALRGHPGCRWSYTAVERVDGSGQVIPDIEPWIPYDGAIVEPLLAIAAYVATPTVVAERSLVEEAGAFDEQLRFGEDYDLWLRLAALSHVTAVNQRLARVRRHADNHSHDRAGFYQGWLSLYEKAFSRLTDPRLRLLCTRKRAQLGLELAHLHADAGNTGASWQALTLARPDAHAYPGWWMGATKAITKSLLPAPWRNAYRRLRGQVPPLLRS